MLGWISNLFIVAGLWGVGNQSRVFLLVGAVGNIGWFSISVARADWALASLCVVLISLSVRGYLKWGSHAETV